MKRRNFIRLLGASSAMVMVPSLSFGNLRDQSVNSIFNDGDTVCFIGASITHNGAWHVFVSNYFITRFPKIRTRFVNCGISGDIAAGALKRLKDDVLPNKPTHAVIMLGMNDVRRELYDTDTPSAENMAQRRKASESYRSDMEKVVRELKNNGCSSIILVTTSPYDETSLIDKLNLIKLNDELAVYADILREIARKHSTRFVDIHGPMIKMSQLLQKSDPKFSFAPGDRIHPGDLGHQYMAYLFLESLNVPAIVSEVSLTYNKQHPDSLSNANLTALVFSENKLSFDLLESALPYPVKKDIPTISNIVPIEGKLNRQELKIKSIPLGNWTLRIDGTDIGEFTSQKLQQGINLSNNSKTPQFIQAQKVLETNLEYYYQEAAYRDNVKIRIMFKEENIDLNNDTEIKSFFDTFPKTKGKYAETYFNSLFSHYFVNKDNLIPGKEKLELLFQQLYTCNQPVSHHFELAKVY